VDRVRPAVVNITAVHEIAIPFLRRGWPSEGQGGSDEVLRRGALGSGFIIDAEGHVVTNAHVVDQADAVRVRLADDREFRARTVAKDKQLDVAVLKLEGPTGQLPVASLGSSDGLNVGDYVVAIGNPFGLGDSVTMGIVSAKSRALGAGPYDDFIQTDAPINPGNSGGPLFDLHGQVVGISTAINPQGQGIGFAIPINDVKHELPDLIAKGSVSRARLGVAVQEMDDTLAKAFGLDRRRGALIAQVQAGGPAARARIQEGDVVLSVDGRDVGHAIELPRTISSYAPGSHVRLTVFRDRKARDIDVTLGALPTEPEGVTSKQAAPRSETRSGTAPIGITVGNAPGRGAMVESVNPRGPADGKLAPGDVVETVNRQSVSDAGDLMKKLSQAPKDQPILLRVQRGNLSRFVAIARE
jgi:serine protease Do